MKKFSDFNIKIETTNFTGDKIKIAKILNLPIIVHAYKIEDSKVFKGDCIHLQIEFKGEKHICFSGSKTIIEQIKQVPSFPFSTAITLVDERYKFS